MKNKLFIDESEKSRILEMHKSAINKTLLNEETPYSPPTNGKNTTNNVNKPSFLESCKSAIKNIDLGKLLGGFGIINAIPIHLRLFLFYLYSRSTKFTEKDLNSQELKVLTEKTNFLFKNSKCKGSKKCSADFYAGKVDFKKLKSGEEDQIFVDDDKKLSYSFGNAQIEDKGNYYVLTDIYDFNNYERNPEYYSLEVMPLTIKFALNKIFCGNFVQGVEELASFKQSWGYKGFPVEIRIEKT